MRVQRFPNTYVWHLDLVALLEVLGEGIDEFFGSDVLDGDSTAGIDSGKLDLKVIRRNSISPPYLLPFAYVYIK